MLQVFPAARTDIICSITASRDPEGKDLIENGSVVSFKRKLAKPVSIYLHFKVGAFEGQNYPGPFYPAYQVMMLASGGGKLKVRSKQTLALSGNISTTGIIKPISFPFEIEELNSGDVVEAIIVADTNEHINESTEANNFSCFKCSIDIDFEIPFLDVDVERKPDMVKR